MVNSSPVVLTRRHKWIIGALACCVSITFAVVAISPLFAEAQSSSTSKRTESQPDTDPAERLVELAKKKFGKLSQVEELFFRIVAIGQMVRCRGGSEMADNPSNAEAWPAERGLAADRIAWLCTDPQASGYVTQYGIEITGARIDGELNLAYCKIPFPLCFWRCAFTEKITLNSAEIRMLFLGETHTKEIDADGLKAEGSLFLGKIKVGGILNLTGANIGGNLDCSEGVFSNANGIALSFIGAKVGGSIRLDNAKTQGEVNLTGAAIGTDLWADGATFVNKTGRAFLADRMNVGGLVSFCGLNATGEVRLVGARVGSSMQCNETEIVGTNSTSAFTIAGLVVGSSLFLQHTTVRGVANLTGVTIVSDLSCSGSQFVNKGGVALLADGLRTGGSVFLRDGFAATGEVNLLLASIGRSLDCSKGRFINPDGIALRAGGVRVEGSVLLIKGFDANGTVDLGGATIGSSLVCEEGQMINTNKAGVALVAQGVKIGCDLILVDGFKAQGVVNLASAMVNHSFFLEKISSNSDVTLQLHAARVGTLCDDESSWPARGKLGLNGFVYDGIGTRSPKDAKTRIDWLKRQPSEQFLPQPYEQLASVLRKAGYEEDEKEVLIAKNRDRAERVSWRQPIRWWYGLLAITIGYGYRPEYALYWSLGIIGLGWLLFSWRAKSMTPTEKASSERCPKFNALLYSFETFVPLTKLQLAEYWLPKEGLLRFYLWLHSTAGLVLITLLVGALTGLIKT